MNISAHSLQRFKERFKYLCNTKEEQIRPRLWHLYKRAVLLTPEEVDSSLVTSHDGATFYLNKEHSIVFVIRDNTIVTVCNTDTDSAGLLNCNPIAKIQYLGKELQKRDLEILALKKALLEIPHLKGRLNDAIKAKNETAKAYKESLKNKMPDDWTVRLRPYMEYYFNV
jgi:hypothetical protein